MTDTSKLDDAIFAGQKALGTMARKGEMQTPVEADRTYARAFVAELLRGMERTEVIIDFDIGFNAALFEIKSIAGVVEGGCMTNPSAPILGHYTLLRNDQIVLIDKKHLNRFWSNPPVDVYWNCDGYAFDTFANPRADMDIMSTISRESVLYLFSQKNFTVAEFISSEEWFNSLTKG